MLRLRRLPYHLRTLYGGLAIGALLTLVCVLVLPGLSFLQRAELSAYDWQFNIRGSRPAPANIEIVGLDATSIDDLSSTYPIPRAQMAKAVCFLHRAGAKVIGIDFSYYTDSVYGKKDDAALVKCLHQAGNVVTNEQLDAGPASNFITSGSSTLYKPIPAIARAAAALGIDNVPLDADSEVRRADLIQYGFGGGHYSFPLVVAGLATHQSPAALARTLPTDMYINYIGPERISNPGFQSWPQVQFEGVSLGEDPPSLFRNKIVLIIPHAIVTNDHLLTPFGDTYGGFVQANTLATILNHNPIVPAGDGINDLVIALIGLTAAVITARLGIWHSVAAALVLAIGFPVVTVIAFGHNYWLHLVIPEVTLVLVFAAIMAFRFATEERQKRRTHRLFGQYVKKEVVDILVNAPDEETALRGARRPVSVLFVDIRGFTAMSEHMQPENVIEVLDVYLEQLTLAVEATQGSINKYVGDELFAMWNAPLLQPDHALRAVRTGLDMVARMEPINEVLAAKGQPRIKYGIGVNTGEAIVGSMGSSLRKQYDVISDAVNTGARLCSAAGGGELIIGQATWEAIGHMLMLEETPPLTLKGKSDELRTFKVLGIREDAAVPVPSESVTAVH